MKQHLLTDLPAYIGITFIITTVLTLLLFYLAMRMSTDKWIKHRSNSVLTGLVIWLGIHALIAESGFYVGGLNSLPPRLVIIGIWPNVIVMFILFLTKKGRQFIDGLSLKMVTWLNVVRIPVEVVLFWLAFNDLIPNIMTFAGWNYDILAGLSAPFAANFFFTKKSIGKKTMLAWNIICLMLLLTIVTIGILSAPFPVQQFAFDQPNIALLSFPYVWLPVFIVPVVLFGHLVSIRRLTR